MVLSSLPYSFFVVCLQPELPEEMRIFQKQLDLGTSILELRKLREELSSYADSLTHAVGMSTEEVEERLAQIEDDDWKVKEKLTDANREYHSSFHPRWGQMFVVSTLWLAPKYFLLSFPHTYFSLIQ